MKYMIFTIISPLLFAASIPEDNIAKSPNGTTNSESDAASTPIPQVNLSIEENPDLPIIIGCVCVVALVLVISVFVFVLCRMCQGGSRSNRALLGKVPLERGSEAGDCSGGNTNSGRKTNAFEANHHNNVSDADGRFMAYGVHPPPGGFCVANTIAAGEVPPPSKPIDMYSALLNGNGNLFNLKLNPACLGWLK